MFYSSASQGAEVGCRGIAATAGATSILSSSCGGGDLFGKLL